MYLFVRHGSPAPRSQQRKSTVVASTPTPSRDRLQRLPSPSTKRSNDLSTTQMPTRLVFRVQFL